MSIIATLTTNKTGSFNYLPYIYNVTKTDNNGKPDLLDFALCNYDGNAAPFTRGTYITLTTDSYGVWFSGFLTNSGNPVPIGSDNIGVPRWAYTYEATSDEYILNLHPLGIIPPFVNMTQGQILKKLIAMLAPDNFPIDTTGITDGQLIPRYVVDPSQHFSDIINDFATAANYRFWIKNLQAFYVQQDSVAAALAIDGNDEHFTPKNLSVSTAQDPIINDAVVIGMIEPQNWMSEYFVSDGMTAQFPLISAVFSVDSAVLLDDAFTGSSIDNSKWTTYDATSGVLVPSNGFMNALGGSNNNTLDVHLDAANLVPLEGTLRATHGEFDFVLASSGIVGSLWTDHVGAVPFAGTNLDLHTGDLTGWATQGDTSNWGSAYSANGGPNNTHNIWATTKNSTIAAGATVTCQVTYDILCNLYDTFSLHYDVTATASLPAGVTSSTYVEIWPMSGSELGTPLGPFNVQSPNFGWTMKQLSFMAFTGGLTGARLAFITTLKNTTASTVTINTATASMGISNVSLTSLNNCFYGIYCSKDQTNTQAMYLSPLTRGVGVDTTQSIAVDYTKRYILRTLYTFGETLNQLGHYSAINSAGNVIRYGGTSVGDICEIQTVITEIDPNTAATTNQWKWTSVTRTLANQAFGQYSLLVCDDMHCSVTGVTVSTPMQVTLEQKPPTNVPQVFAGAGGTLQASPNPLPSGVTTTTLNWTSFQATSVTIHTSSPLGPIVPGGAGLAGNGSLNVSGNIVFPGAQFFLVDNTTQAMLAALTLSGADGSPWISQYIGPNEIDSQDGMAPVATIVDSNNGASTKQSLLGTANYNPGQASLQYFKNTAQYQSYIPEKGTVIRVTYRRAGAAIARVRDSASVATEASEWGDDGIRSDTRNDLKPLPRTSAECEMAAAALVQGNNYQHYTGTYSIQSGPWLSSEPVTATILKFQNLDQFPDFPSDLTTAAEAITQVVTTFDHLNGGEQFSHQISFGPLDPLSRALGKLRRLDDVFTPQDTAELPFYSDLQAVGNNVVPGVIAPKLSSWDTNNLHFTMDMSAPSQGGFEVRYTDAGWGADNGGNLIMRTAASAFAVPRNSRGRVVYVKAYDARNKLPYSEDMTRWSFVGNNPPTVVNGVHKDPDGNLSVLSAVTFGAVNSNLLYTLGAATGLTATFSVSLKGPAGTPITVRLEEESSPFSGNEVAVVLTGGWQRISVSTTWDNTVTGNVTPIIRYRQSSAVTVQVARASVEYGTATETIYCKTNGSSYGAMSRYAYGVHVGLPLVTQAPTATITATDPANPVVTLTLPAALDDIWGVEIRAADNQTVLVHFDMTDSNYLQIPQQPSTYIPNYSKPYYKIQGNTSRSLTYYCYTYNLLGEYSAPYVASYTIPVPAIALINVSDTTKTLSVTVGEASKVHIDVIPGSNPNGAVAYTTDITATLAADNFATVSWTIPDQFFLPPTFFNITPSDTLGKGTTIQTGHSYIPTNVVEFGINEVAAIPSPASPSTAPVVPPNMTSFSSDSINESLSNYAINQQLRVL